MASCVHVPLKAFIGAVNFSALHIYMTLTSTASCVAYLMAWRLDQNLVGGVPNILSAERDFSQAALHILINGIVHDWELASILPHKKSKTLKPCCCAV